MKRFFIALLALVTMLTGARADDMKATPLTLEAISDGEITFLYSLSLYHDAELADIEYQLNDGAWTTYTWNDPIAVSAGNKVAFRGNNASYMGNGKGYDSHITSTADVYVYGNVMSLINSTDFATLTTLTGKDAFSHLFSVPGATPWDVVPNTTIKNHPTKDLVLPATTLTNMCYMNMFTGCQGLTRAPELPATVMPVACYASMFEGCSSLTVAPALPTTTFTPYGFDPVTFEEYGSIDCYMMMFKDCTSLTEAPALPATELIHGVYQNMFQGCTSLERAPELPAPIVADYAYSYMFDGCTSLNYVKCLATDFLIDPDMGNTAEDNVMNWLNNVAATGTFVKAAGMTSWAEGVNGIPAGWTVVNDGEEQPSGVPINADNFPDENFRNYLMRQTFGQDGLLTDEEIASVTDMYCGYEDIADLTGIQYFTALKELKCDRNQLTSLDVSALTELTYITCERNKLQTLDLTANTKLGSLHVSENELTVVKLPQTETMKRINVSWNKLTELDLTGLTKLIDLNCTGNQLTVLGTGHCLELQQLSCSTNKLAELDLSSHTQLIGLWCEDNQLTSLKVSSSSPMTTLYCSANLLSEAVMEILVESLPETTNGRFVAIDKSKAEEQNIISTEQVATAKAKGWIVYDNNNYNIQEYEGSIPTGVGRLTLDSSQQGEGTWYTLDGRRLAEQPTAKGLYINHGKKVVRR